MWYSAQVDINGQYVSPFEGAQCKSCQSNNPRWEQQWTGPTSSQNDVAAAGLASPERKNINSNDPEIQELRRFAKSAAKLDPLVRLIVTIVARKERKHVSYSGAVADEAN
jgi:hypothetical protein